MDSDSVFQSVTPIRITAIHTLMDIIGRTHIMVSPARRFIGPTATGFIIGIITGTTGTGIEPALARLSTGGWKRPPVTFLANRSPLAPSLIPLMATFPEIPFSDVPE